MNRVHDDLLSILDAVLIESPSRYLLHGQAREVSESRPSGIHRESEPNRLVVSLAVDLYDRFYIRPPRHVQRAFDPVARRDLIGALSAANTGRGSWEPGWTVRRIQDDGQVVVSKGDVEFCGAPKGVRKSGDRIRPDEHCQVWVAKELRELVPGFYLAIGDGPTHSDDDAGTDRALGRYYWHLTALAAVPFMAMATSLLNDAQVAFRAKVLSDPGAFHRADAGVLYIRPRDYARVEPIIAGLHAAVVTSLRPEVPLFTKRLADGLGFAEDPISSMSFGQHRCKVAARALWQSFEKARVDRDSRISALAAAFFELNLDPLLPYLGPGSRDESVPQPLHVHAPSATGRDEIAAIAGGNSVRAPSLLLRAAVIEIGRTLCRTAFWDRGGRLCNWVSRSSDEITERGGPITPTAKALGPDLYCGSAGIALFLAQLYELGGDDDCRRTALGAIERCVQQYGRFPPKPPLSPLSFFSGTLGAAWVAHRVAALTGETGLDAHIKSLLDQVALAVDSPHLLDVIGGNAGAIPVLLAMGRAPGLERCRELAITLGEELCREGAGGSPTRPRDADAMSATATAEPFSSGFAHGAAGIGLALFELHAATGRLDFRDAARRWFECEDDLFDAREGNWVNTRNDSVHARFDLAWCNGAPESDCPGCEPPCSTPIAATTTSPWPGSLSRPRWERSSKTSRRRCRMRHRAMVWPDCWKSS